MSMKTLSLGAKLATDCAQHADTEEEKSRHSARTVEEEASYSSNLSLTESARILSSPHKKSQLYDLIEVVPKKPPSGRRRSLFGSTPLDEPLDQSDALAPKKPASQRRRSLFGSTLSSDEKELISKPPASASLPPQSMKNAGSPAPMPMSRKKHSSHSPGSHSRDGGSTPPKPKSSRIRERKPNSSRRKSLGGSDIEEEAEKPRSTRRRSLTDNSARSTPEKPRFSPRPSLGCASADSTSSVEAPINIHELIGKKRTDKGLHEFSRNMLMDTIAKQVAPSVLPPTIMETLVKERPSERFSKPC
jgi:hypothetical protein